MEANGTGEYYINTIKKSDIARRSSAVGRKNLSEKDDIRVNLLYAKNQFVSHQYFDYFAKKPVNYGILIIEREDVIFNQINKLPETIQKNLSLLNEDAKMGINLTQKKPQSVTQPKPASLKNSSTDIEKGKELFEATKKENTFDSMVEEYKKKTQLNPISQEEYEKEFEERIEEKNKLFLAEMKKNEEDIKKLLNENQAKLAKRNEQYEDTYGTAYQIYQQAVTRDLAHAKVIRILALYREDCEKNKTDILDVTTAFGVNSYSEIYDQISKIKTTKDSLQTLGEVIVKLGTLSHPLSKKLNKIFLQNVDPETTKQTEQHAKDSATSDLGIMQAEIIKAMNTENEKIEKKAKEYNDRIKEHQKLLEKEKSDFEEIKRLREEAVNSMSNLEKFGKISTTVGEIKKSIEKKKQYFSEGKYEFHINKITTVLNTIQEQKKIAKEQLEELQTKLKTADISLDDARKLSTKKVEILTELINAAERQVNSAEEIRKEAEKEFLREKQSELYTLLEEILVKKVDFWGKQQGLTGGTDVADEKRVKTHVPTGIGDMIIKINQENKAKKTDSRFKLFAKKRSTTSEKSAKDQQNIISTLEAIQKKASDRIKVKSSFFNRRIGRTKETSDFYGLVSKTKTNDIQSLQTTIDGLKTYKQNYQQKKQKKLSSK